MKEWFIANLGSIGKCPVFFDLLWSICVFIVVEHSTGHAGVHCLRPIEKNLELLPSICPKIMQNILSLLLFSDKYILSSPQEHCFWTVHKGNQAEEVLHARKFSLTSDSVRFKDNEVFLNNSKWSHLLVWTHWSRWRRSSRFLPCFPLIASSSFLYGFDHDLQFWRSGNLRG